MARIKMSEINRAFHGAAEALELSTEAWTHSAAENRSIANVGAIYLDYAPIYGGFQINQMANTSGGERTLLPRRLKAAEFLMWCDGVQFVFGQMNPKRG